MTEVEINHVKFGWSEMEYEEVMAVLVDNINWAAYKGKSLLSTCMYEIKLYVSINTFKYIA